MKNTRPLSIFLLFVLLESCSSLARKHQVSWTVDWQLSRTIGLMKEQYSTPYEQKKVAVLIDRMTMSSGEAIAVAFKGRKNTRFFGKPTCGLTTGNQQYLLWNGDKLLLTVSYFADRDKNVYSSPIQPDLEIDEQSMVIEKAIEWVLQNNEYTL